MFVVLLSQRSSRDLLYVKCLCVVLLSQPSSRDLLYVLYILYFLFYIFFINHFKDTLLHTKSKSVCKKIICNFFFNTYLK